MIFDKTRRQLEAYTSFLVCDVSLLSLAESLRQFSRSFQTVLIFIYRRLFQSNTPQFAVEMETSLKKVID